MRRLKEKHNVKRGEIIDALESRPKFRFVEKGHQKGENVYAALGQTSGGRYLIVFFVYKKNGRILILSARDMTKSERRLYESG